MTVQQGEKSLSMVEKVARALANHIHQGGDYGMTGEEAFDDRRDDYLAMARAAIEAMREPTDAMIDAGVEAKLNLYRGLERQGKNTRCMLVADHPAGTIYVGMIDAALSEESIP